MSNSVKTSKNTSIFDVAESLIKNGVKGCSVFIPHINTTQNRFCGGISSLISNKYPIVKANFEVNGPKNFGKVQLIKACSGLENQALYIANIIALSSDMRKIKYQFFIEGLVSLKRHIEHLTSLNAKNNFQVHISQKDFPCSKNEFYFIKNIINDILGDSVSVYYY